MMRASLLLSAAAALAACTSDDPGWTAADFGCEAASTQAVETTVPADQAALVVSATLGDTDIDVTDCFRWRVGVEHEERDGEVSFTRFDAIQPDGSGRRYLVPPGEVAVETRDGSPRFVDAAILTHAGETTQAAFAPAIGAVVVTFLGPEDWTVDLNAQMRTETGGRSSSFMARVERADRTLFLHEGQWRFQVEARAPGQAQGEGHVQSREVAVAPGAVVELEFSF